MSRATIERELGKRMRNVYSDGGSFRIVVMHGLAAHIDDEGT
jgi:hypothetical protein